MENDKPNMETHGDLSSVKVTVFTPTFNRRHTLERVYKSLQQQTFKDFEWLIIDDGSTDDTKSLVAKWLKEENFFPIRYQWKSNGGKHTAHNLAISLARGEYFAIIDSDDWYTPEALTFLMEEWNRMQDNIKERFSNIEGLCCYEDGTLIGQPYPLNVYDSDYISIQNLRTKPMDTRGMYRLDILKKFPFPDNLDRCFVPESLIWNRIAEKYKTRHLNKTIGFVEYQPEGLSKRPYKMGLDNSAPYILHFREMAERESTPLIKKLKCRTNVYRYSFHNRLPLRIQYRESIHELIDIVFVVVGYLAYLKDSIAILQAKR